MVIRNSTSTGLEAAASNKLITPRAIKTVIRVLDELRRYYDQSNITYDLIFELRTLQTDEKLAEWNEQRKKFSKWDNKRFVRSFHKVLISIDAKHVGNGLLDEMHSVLVTERGKAEWVSNFTLIGNGYPPIDVDGRLWFIRHKK